MRTHLISRGTAAGAAAACLGVVFATSTTAMAASVPALPALTIPAVPTLPVAVPKLPTLPPVPVPTLPTLPVATPALPTLPGLPTLPSTPSLNPSLPAASTPGIPSVSLPAVSNGGGTSGAGSQQPGATAEANGVALYPLQTCVDCTGSTAGPSSGSNHAATLALLGTTLIGSGESSGTASGSLLTLADNPLVGAAIADWSEAAASSHGSSSSHARASLFDMNIAGGQVATVALLESLSDASWSPTGASNHAVTNGARAEVLNGALAVVILHSDSSTGAPSSVYLVALNGTAVPAVTVGAPPSGATQALSKATSVPMVPAIAAISLLQTGSGSTWSSGTVAAITNALPSMLGTGETGVVLATDVSANHVATAGSGTSTGSGTGTAAGPGASRGGVQPIPVVSHPVVTPVAAANPIPGFFTALSTPLTGAGLRSYGVLITFGGLFAMFWARRFRPRRFARAALARIM